MSVLNTSHAVMIHTDSSKPADVTQRLCVIAWKTPSDKKNDSSYKRPAARCVSLPKISLAAKPECLQSVLRLAFEEMQDAIIRDKINTALAASSDGNPSVIISDEEITPEAVAAFAAAKAVSSKLSKDLLATWFDSSLSDQLTVALAGIMKLPDEPSPEQRAKLDVAIKQHKEMITSLASPKASLSEKVAKQLQRALKLAGEGDRIAVLLNSKLQVFVQPKEVTLALGLGEE